MGAYKTSVLNALGWTAGGKVVSQVLSFGIGIALARLLNPDAFGLIAMMIVFTGFASLLTDVGLGSALVQKKDVTEAHYSTVFWTNLGLGTTLTLTIFSISPYIASFYGREELTEIGRILSLQFIINAIALVPRIRLVKQLTFRVIATADLCGMLIAGVCAIFMASNGYGYYALAWQPLIVITVATIFVWSYSRWAPAVLYSRAALGELFSFSAFNFANRIVQYFSQQLDKLLTGRFLGGESVGLLDKAQSMMLFPLRNISHTVGSVMFPALSQVQEQKQRVRSVYMRSTHSIALLTFPMMSGMFAVADTFVYGVLGEQWEGVIPILRVLCIAGLANSIVTIVGSVYLSQGQAKLMFMVTLITRPLAIAGVVIGLFSGGVIGVVIGSTIASYINSVISLRAAGKLIDLSLYSLLGPLFKTLLLATIMGICVYYFGIYVPLKNELYVFVSQLFLGALIYLALIFLFRPPAFDDLLELIVERIRNRKAKDKIGS
ncbi:MULTISPECIES: MOP flippase family protein [unclassified Marinobacter]|jgi:PST family polysaccharide transporter|uniref:MOP flippase family protein n=1 Tax=unclassified Marinobacter TaxID=83889 RepID=UPI000C0DC6F4|nr:MULTISPECIES: MOP flippase family protein [unclassified Marinobacter]MAB50852.1 colanic acid exporter [Marinobacter sp.]MBN14856.1 colanic acid exporter [Pelagibacterium sp.]PHR88506.1 MAG: colanic acid exporter [Leeuwenhoekiella sp.]|tara:strand:- start:833 stop:2308 length:1476 start_codon:yes stop_codon:yes gene_type:complete